MTYNMTVFDITIKNVNAIAITVSKFWMVKSYKKFEIDNLRSISPPLLQWTPVKSFEYL